MPHVRAGALHSDDLGIELQTNEFSGKSFASPWASMSYRRKEFGDKPPFVAVIDDDGALCSSLVDLIRSIGYRAEPFDSAETFFESVNRSNLDCIIADVHMPGMGGFNLVRELRGRGIKTPVILITARPGKYLDAEAISIGATCLLRKPFETSSLLSWIERSLH